jgi:PEGA domain-containing protein
MGRVLGPLALVATVAWSAVCAAAVTDEHYALGAKAFEDSDFPRAVEELTASLTAHPSLRAYQLRADANVKLSRIDDARADYEAALKLEPSSKKRALIERSLRDLATATKTRLAVTSQPPGAIVYLDLKAAGQRGVTPVVIPTSPGRHRVFVELDGYDPFVAREVDAAEDHETPLAVTLVVKGCDLHVEATPAGATVSVDGAAARPAPLQLRVRGGDHLVRLERPGSQPRQKSLTCVVGTPLSVQEALDAVPPGRLVVALANVSDARLRVDGKHAEASGVALAPGDHALRVDAADREPWESQVQVVSGQELRLAPRLAVRGKGDWKSSPWLWVGVGIGVAGLAVGLGVGLGLALAPAGPAPIGHFGGQHVF